MFPISLITKLVKPALGLIISQPAGITKPGDPQDSLMSKNWRPYTAVIFVAIIVLDVFTAIELSDATLTALGATIIVLIGGRSYEKAQVEKAIKALKDLN